jgi:hypothetical protein
MGAFEMNHPRAANPSRRRRRNHQQPDANSYLPSPEEVRSMCDRIQKGWNTNEREKRSSYKQAHWTAPMVSAPELGGGFEA